MNLLLELSTLAHRPGALQVTARTLDRAHPHLAGVRCSQWVEAAADDGTVFPLRVRIVARGERVRCEAQYRYLGEWKPHRHRFRWIPIGFEPSPKGLDLIACNGADAVFDYLDGDADWPAVYHALTRGTP